LKWTNKHIKQFKEAEEYVDTVLTPLVPFTLQGKDAEKKALQYEVMTIFANEIEQKLTGRLFQFPHYIYESSADLHDETERLNDWINKNNNEYFKHHILLTFDASWRKTEKYLEGNLLWIPAMYSGDIYSKEVTQMMQDQINEIIELIQSYW